jgi:hypothetical protein
LHPAAALLVCLIAIVVIQFLGWLGLALVFPVLLLATRKPISGWWHLLRRMRLLLLGVWLILAYGASGDALYDVAWLPTDEGVRDATLHVARLGLMLGCLAWLFAFLGNHGLLVALQSLLHPLSRLGLASERFVVRLSLVMQNLQVKLPKGAWRNMINGSGGDGDGPKVLRFEVPAWSANDSLICLAVLTFSCLAISLG